MKNKFLYTLLAVIVSILVFIVPAIHPAGRHVRKAGVNNATMNTIREYLALNPEAVSVQELERKKQAAYNAAATMPNRLRIKHQAHIAQKNQQLQQMVLHASNGKKASMQQRNQIPARQQKPKSLPQPVQRSKNNVQDSQDEAKEDAQPADTTTSHKRDIIGAVGALGLVLLYEFVIAPKMGTKKLGIAEFCTAVMNKQNPLTVKLDGPQGTDNTDDNQQQAGPGFLKRFGFDIFCSFFGL